MYQFINNFLCTVILFLFLILFVKFFFKKKVCVSFFSFLLLLFICSIIISVFYVYNFSILRSIISWLFSCIFVKYVFKIKFSLAFLFSFYYILLLPLSEAIIFLLFDLVFGQYDNILYSKIAGGPFGGLLVELFLFFIFLFFKKFLIKFSNIRLKGFLFFCIFMLSLCFFYFFYITFNFNGIRINLYVGIFILFLLFLIIYFYLYQFYNNYELCVKYDKLLEFIKKYEVEIERQRIFRHETKNQLLTIKSKLIDCNVSSNIIEYIDEVISDNNNEIKYILYSKLNKLPSNGLRGLFYFKINEAQEKGIKVSINISNKLVSSFLKKLNSNTFNQLCKLIGIIFDNAIEGCQDMINPMIGVDVIDYSGFIIFRISNNYNKQNNNNYSFKKFNRGHGLILARNIIRMYDQFSLKTEIFESIYCQEITIRNI